MKKNHSHNSGTGREWKKSIPEIREREGNEKIHCHNSGKGIRGFHSWEWTGTGFPAHPCLRRRPFVNILIAWPAVGSWADPLRSWIFCKKIDYWSPCSRGSKVCRGFHSNYEGSPFNKGSRTYNSCRQCRASMAPWAGWRWDLGSGKQYHPLSSGPHWEASAKNAGEYFTQTWKAHHIFFRLWQKNRCRTCR